MNTKNMVVAVSGYVIDRETGETRLAILQCAEDMQKADQLFANWKHEANDDPDFVPEFQHIWLH
jgi:hypothetical protein